LRPSRRIFRTLAPIEEGGIIHAALYELNDPEGLEKRLQAADHGNPKSRNVILGNEQSVVPGTKEAIEDADSANRGSPKAAGVSVIDRILGKGSIPHNKFMVLGDPRTIAHGGHARARTRRQIA
jgi:hypothetical protein